MLLGTLSDGKEPQGCERIRHKGCRTISKRLESDLWNGLGSNLHGILVHRSNTLYFAAGKVYQVVGPYIRAQKQVLIWNRSTELSRHLVWAQFNIRGSRLDLELHTSHPRRPAIQFFFLLTTLDIPPQSNWRLLTCQSDRQSTPWWPRNILQGRLCLTGRQCYQPG